ncbi:MAG TPA: hypothetical protein VKB96_08260, partial [Gammaproteobacteria bacterium]|nr:hypothetical protein [Gammaproteobacteria bacterium]
MKKQRHGEAPQKTKIQPLKSVSHNFLILISCSSVIAGISEHATASSTCEVFENPTSTAAVLVGFSNTSHVDEAVACSEMPALTEEQLIKMRKLWETDFSG